MGNNQKVTGTLTVYFIQVSTIQAEWLEQEL